MANGQYTIPEAFRKPEPQPELQQQPEPNYEAQQSAVFSARLDAQQSTPENQPLAFSSVGQLSNRLESYQTTVIALEAKRFAWLKAAKALMITPKPMRAELIEKESVIVGSLVRRQAPSQENRIWVHDGDLFYGYADRKHGILLQDTTVRYQFSDEYLEGVMKSFQAKIVPLASGEKENVAAVLGIYESAVVEELYPIDATLMDLKKEDLELAA